MHYKYYTYVRLLECNNGIQPCSESHILTWGVYLNENGSSRNSDFPLLRIYVENSIYII